MEFSEILGSMKRDGSTWLADVPDSWLQGRSVFGGLQTAIALRAMRGLVAPEIPLRVVSTTFVAPVGPGVVRARARVLRSGKNVTHAEARLGDDENSAVVVGVFGAGRPSRASIVPVRRDVPRHSVTSIPFMPGLSPSFVQHFRNRWLTNGFPFTGQRATSAFIEIDMKDSCPATAEHVVAIADAIPPLALSFLESPAPGSSLTWTLELLRESFDDLSLSGYRLDAELVAGGSGYTSQSVMVWGPGGEPLALSRQTMVVFG